MAVIYRIVNVVTDEVYIGSARNPKKRRWEHWTDLKKGQHHCVALQAAWDQFSEDAFEFEILEEVADETDLLRVEDTYLVRFAGSAGCYNTALSSMQPPSVQPVTIEKIRQTMLRKWKENPELHPRLGRAHTDETKAKISASKRANPTTYWAGKTRSEETRQKISDAQKGVPKGSRTYTPEGLAKIQAVAVQNLPEQKPLDFTQVLAKFPTEVQTKYDFSQAVYTGALNRISGVRCPDHGVFSQYSAQFRKGRGCPSCGGEERAASKKEQMKQAWQTEAGRQQFMGNRRKNLHN